MKLKKIFFLFLCLIIVLFVFRNIVVRTVITMGFRFATGLYVSVDGCHVDALHNKFLFDTVTVYNPTGFLPPVMVQCENIQGGYDLRSLLKGRMHLLLLRGSVEQVFVVRNEKGDLNIAPLQQFLDEDHDAGQRFLCDDVALFVGGVLLEDYTKIWNGPFARFVKINTMRVGQDVIGARALCSLVFDGLLIEP